MLQLIDFGWGQIFSKKSPNPKGDRESEFDNSLLVPLPEEEDLGFYPYENLIGSATSEYPLSDFLINRMTNNVPDIFQVGLIMFDIITHGKIKACSDTINAHVGPCHINAKMRKLSENGRKFLGWELYENPTWGYYSQELRALVVKCLVREAIHRPTSVELQQRTQKGMEQWRGKAERSPYEFPMFKNIPMKSYRGTPLESWKLVDDTTIDLMFEAHESVKSVEKPWPWVVFVRDLPLSMHISLLKKQLHAQLRVRGNQLGSDGNSIKCYDIKPEEQILWRWDRELLDEETLGSIGVGDWERITCFSKSAAPSEIQGLKVKLRELDESEADYRRQEEGHDSVLVPRP